MAYTENEKWLNMDDIGYIKLVNVLRNQHAKFGSPQTGLADYINFEVVNKNTKQSLSPAVKCVFYYTDDAKNKPACKFFYDLVSDALNGVNSGIFSGLHYNVSKAGTVFLVPNQSIKIIY